MDLQDETGPPAHRPLIVGRPRSVRGAHLDETGGGDGHDLRQPELTADLDQLAARHQYVLARSERGEREKERSRAVVYYERRLGARERLQQRFGASRSPSTRSGLALDLEIGIPERRARRGLGCLPGQRRTPQAGVEDDPARVDDLGKSVVVAGGRSQGPGQDHRVLRDGVTACSGAPDLVQRVVEGLLHEGAAELRDAFLGGAGSEKRVDGRNVSPCVRGSRSRS